MMSCDSIGTGVVTSVPSDSPDDFAALRDLQKKAVSVTLIIEFDVSVRPLHSELCTLS